MMSKKTWSLRVRRGATFDTTIHDGSEASCRRKFDRLAAVMQNCTVSLVDPADNVVQKSGEAPVKAAVDAGAGTMDLSSVRNQMRILGEGFCSLGDTLKNLARELRAPGMVAPTRDPIARILEDVEDGPGGPDELDDPDDAEPNVEEMNAKEPVAPNPKKNAKPRTGATSSIRALLREKGPMLPKDVKRALNLTKGSATIPYQKKIFPRLPDGRIAVKAEDPR